MASLQDPVLGYHVGAPYAAGVYDTAPAGKKRILLQGPLRKVYGLTLFQHFFSEVSDIFSPFSAILHNRYGFMMLINLVF